MSRAMIDAFLARQFEDGMALAAESDLFDLVPGKGTPPDRYVAQFYCKTLVRNPDGGVVVASYCAVAILFPEDYLLRADPYQVLVWLGPRNIWHPNISDKAPLVCLGRLGPGSRLVDLVYQLFDIITFKNVSMGDALNADASAWARQNQHRFPIDPRPLKRRRVVLGVSSAPGEPS